MIPTRPRCLSISLLLSITTTRSLPRRYSRGGLLPNKCRPYICEPRRCQVKTGGFFTSLLLRQIDEVGLGPQPLKVQVLCGRAHQLFGVVDEVAERELVDRPGAAELLRHTQEGVAAPGEHRVLIDHPPDAGLACERSLHPDAE